MANLRWSTQIALSVVALSIFALALGYGLGRMFPSKQASFVTPAQIAKVRETPAQPKPRVVPPPLPGGAGGPPVAATSQPTVKDICLDNWTAISRMTDAEFESALWSRQRPLNEECQNKMNLEISIQPVLSFIRLCHEELTALEDIKITENCLRFAPYFRAYVQRQVQIPPANVQNLPSEDLNRQLIGGLMNLKNSTSEEVHKNIEMANAVIERDPSNYNAYKTKLINLLISELKFGERIEVALYNSIYDQLLSLEGVTNDAEVSAELRTLDSDLVHIPFLRLSAKNELDELIDVSQEYINTYPQSYVGYMYLAEGLWRQGDQEQAFEILRQGLNVESADEMVLHLFSQVQSNPMERLFDLSSH